MPSCTTPTFSKIAVTFCATQPAMLEICQASGSAIATVPTPTRPEDQSRTATVPVPTTMQAFIAARMQTKAVSIRSWRR